MLLLPEPLLAGCVPDLQLDLLARNLHYSGPKLHTNGVWTVGHDWGWGWGGRRGEGRGGEGRGGEGRGGGGGGREREGE